MPRKINPLNPDEVIYTIENEVEPVEEQTNENEVEPVIVVPEVKESEFAESFPYDNYFHDVEDEIVTVLPNGDKDYKLVVRRVLRREFEGKHLVKCRIRTAKFFDVTIKHLEHAYSVLNGKKIDGIIINHLIDRFGWSNGQQSNRPDLAKKLNVTVNSIEVATENLKTIIRKKDINKAYIEYVRIWEKEKSVDVIRDTIGV